MHPKISIIVPTFNEEKNIVECLDSIYSQDYPKHMLEVIIVDNGLVDRTLGLARKYPVKIIINPIKDTQVSKRVGFDACTGELFMWMDADMRMISRDWFIAMTYPLMMDKTIVASVTRYKVKGYESSLTKFLTLGPIQRDPVYQVFSPGFDKTYHKKRKGYILCLYTPNKIPPSGNGLV
ncbi:MAG: glycosyltransferase family 2 protein [Patescibacteria group bacterium]